MYQELYWLLAYAIWPPDPTGIATRLAYSVRTPESSSGKTPFLLIELHQVGELSGVVLTIRNVVVEKLMYKFWKLVTVAACLALISPMALAAETEATDLPAVEEIRSMEPEQRREFLEKLSPEQREVLKTKIEAARAKRRAEYEAMSPEEKEAARNERRARYESLSDEEKKALKEKMKKKAKKRRNSAKPDNNKS